MQLLQDSVRSGWPWNVGGDATTVVVVLRSKDVTKQRRKFQSGRRGTKDSEKARA